MTLWRRVSQVCLLVVLLCVAAPAELEMSIVGKVQHRNILTGHIHSIAVFAGDSEGNPFVAMTVQWSGTDDGLHIFTSNDEIEAFLLGMERAVQSLPSLGAEQEITHFATPNKTGLNSMSVKASRPNKLHPGEVFLSVAAADGNGDGWAPIDSSTSKELSELIRTARTVALTRPKKKPVPKREAAP
jgi:hypothetical protein